MVSLVLRILQNECQLTARIVACCKQYAASRLPFPDNVAGRWCTQDTILPNQELLHAVRSADLCDQLNDLWVVVPAVTSNDKKGALSAFRNGEESAGDEGLAVVGLLEDDDLLAEARA